MSDSECSWEGHCEGAVCKVHDDCADDLECTDGICTATGELLPGCSWPGHCAGASCEKDGDCDGDLACRDGVCTVVPGGTATTTGPSKTTPTSGATSSSTSVAPQTSITPLPAPVGNSPSTGSGSDSIGLTTPAKIGIGVGAGAGVLLILAIILLFRNMRRSRKQREEELQANAFENQGYPPMGEIKSPMSPHGTLATELPDTPKPQEIDSYPNHSPYTASELSPDSAIPYPPSHAYSPNAVELPTNYNQMRTSGSYDEDEIAQGSWQGGYGIAR